MALSKNVLNKINKYLEKSGTDSRISVGAKDIKVEFLSTTIPEIDYVMGGGIPKGRVTHLYGMKSGGKSWVCQNVIAEAQRNGLTCAFLDCEGTFSTDWAEKLGIDTEKLLYIPVSGAEVTLQVMRELTESKQVDLIVLDSIAALTPMDEIKKDFTEEAKMAGVAKLMSKAMRVLNSRGEGKVTMIFINQIRDNIGSYMGGSVTPGGKALGFFSTSEISISRGKAITEGTGDAAKNLGYEMRITCDKNKVAVPKKKAVIRVFNDGTVDVEDMVLNMCLREDSFGQFTKQGNGYLLGEEKIASKRDEFITYLKNNQDEFVKLKDMIVSYSLNKELNNTSIIPEEVITEISEEELLEQMQGEADNEKDS